MSAAPPALGSDEVEAYWAAVADADTFTARTVAEGAYARGVPLDAVLMGLIVESQRRVGDLWADNAWTVAREHAATAVSQEVVQQLATRLPEPDGDLVLVACVEREWHALPALVLTQILRSWGRRAEYLGASTSREHLVSRVLDAGPRAVLLSASLRSSLPRVRRHIEAVRGLGTPVVVGGGAFDHAGVRAQRLGATAYAADPTQAADLLGSLRRHVAPAPALRHPGAAEARSLLGSAEGLSRTVTLDVRQALGIGSEPRDRDDWREALSSFLPHVLDCLAGALLTEDATVMTETQQWLAAMLAQRDADPRTVDVLWETLAQHLRDFPEALRMLDPA